MNQAGWCYSLLMGLWLITGPIHAADIIYKWTDAEGRVHYSDQPHAPDAAIVEIRPEPPTPDPGLEARHQRRQKLLEQFNDERRAAAAEAEQQALRKAERAKKCDAARKLLWQYTHSGYLYEQNEQGERRILNDAERAAEEARLREAISEYCQQP